MSSGNNFSRACPVCDRQKRAHFWEKGDLQVVRCSGCRMVYVVQVGEEFASGLFYERRPFYVSAAKLESDYAPVRFERELRLFRQWCPAGAVLDVGCSTGGFLHQLQVRYPESYKILGIDVRGPALDYAENRGLPVSRESFLDLDSGQKRFDAVT